MSNSLNESCSSDSIGNCEEYGCDNDVINITECCNIGLCSLHYIVYRECSRKVCELYKNEICYICLQKNGYQCETCKITFCDDCNTEDIQELERCKC